MPKIAYVPKKFNDEWLRDIQRANQIAEEYAAQGFDLTLRQVYYQFVSRAWIPNTEQSYKRLGKIINDARLAGLIDWNHLTDRTRWVRDNSHWTSPESIMDSVVSSYATERWANQPERPIVMIEKDALVGVIEGVCQELDVPYFSCRGYTSQSEMWSLSQRMRRFIRNDQVPVILHLGDHDPSGVDMTRDIRDRLDLFVTYHGGEAPEVDRLALNMDQIDQYDPPPNPTKLTDSRASGYIDAYGYECWELDALDPPVIAALVREAVMAHRDEERWEEATADMEKERTYLTRVRDKWDTVVEFLAEEHDDKDEE